MRVAGIDTPELQGKCARETRLALEARDLVHDLLRAAHAVELLDARRGKQFHIVARVMADGVDVSKALLSRGLATRATRGTSQRDWCFKIRGY